VAVVDFLEHKPNAFDGSKETNHVLVDTDGTEHAQLGRELLNDVV
jgi:hypothetical protein